MKIASVSCDFVTVSAKIPVRETSMNYGALLVRLKTEDGIEGLGIARVHNFQARATQSVVEEDIGPFLKAMPRIGSPGAAWAEAARRMPRADYNSLSGIAASAMSAVDQALWDIFGQILGKPVYELLGGCQPEIDLYLTFGLNIYTPEEEMEAARRFQAQGFTAFKLQGAGPRPNRDAKHDADRVRRLRETVGPDALVILDGHNNYDLYQAIELLERVEDYNVAYIDEPVRARDYKTMAELRRACPRVRIAGRSRSGHLLENRDLIESGAVDLMGTTVIDQGGFTQSIKIAHMAEAHELVLVTGGAWHLQNAHLIAGASNGWMTEYHTIAAIFSETLFDGAIKPSGGRLRMSDRPGLGFTLNEAAFKEAVERSRSLAGA